MKHQQIISTDVLILGAGPAGLAAASAAARSGRSVLLLDENPQAGGQIWRGGPARWQDTRAQALWQFLQSQPQVSIRFSARVVAIAGDHQLLFECSGQAQLVQWGKLILCQGARELLLPFPGWTLPGVCGAGGLQALHKSGAQLAGQKVMIGGSGPLLLAAADSLQQAGAQVLLIAEQQSWPVLLRFWWRLLWLAPRKAGQALGLFWRLRRIPYQTSSWVSRVTRDEGGQTLQIQLERAGRQRQLQADWLGQSFGLLPNTALAEAFGCRLQDGKLQVDASQQTSRQAIFAAGELTGIGGVDQALAQGELAGLAATDQPVAESLRRTLARQQRFQVLLRDSFALRREVRQLADPDTIICRCEDVRLRQLQQMQQTRQIRQTQPLRPLPQSGDGQPERIGEPSAAPLSWRTAKLMTRLGMGACQGRQCGPVCHQLFGWQCDQPRQPVFPASAASLMVLAAAEQQSTGDQQEHG